MQKNIQLLKAKKKHLHREAQRINYLKVPGKVVGKHQGAHYFTKGQRKGLNVGGTKEPLFIIETDVDKNIIVYRTRQ